jgi:hypothetical protein
LVLLFGYRWCHYFFLRTVALVFTVLLVDVFWFYVGGAVLLLLLYLLGGRIGGVVDLTSYTVLAGLTDVDGDVPLLLLSLLVVVLAVLLRCKGVLDGMIYIIYSGVTIHGAQIASSCVDSVSTLALFRSMCAVPNMDVFCSSLTS